MAKNKHISVVIITRNRIETLLWTLGRLTALPENPQIIVVDNASTDQTPERVKSAFPDVQVIRLKRNHACSARNFGVHAAQTPLVSFCDDDSFWQPGALRLAVQHFSNYPHLGVLAARVLLNEIKKLDPVCTAMKESPITDPRPLPGPAILGFVCCAAVVRRRAYLETGGFNRHFAVAGEERMFSVDMRSKGWSLAYDENMLAYHYPSPSRNAALRSKNITRDTLWYYWLRRPVYYALKHTRLIVQKAQSDPDIRRGLWAAMLALPRILLQRRPAPEFVEREILKIESYY